MSPLLFTLQLEVQGQSWFNSLSPYPNLSFQVLKFSNVTWHSKNLKFYTTQNCFYCVYLSIKCFKPILSKYLLLVQSCPTLWDPINYSLPSSSVHGILQARILEWVAISFSRGSSWPRNRTQVSCIAGRYFTILAIVCVSGLPSGHFSLCIVASWLPHLVQSVGCLYLHFEDPYFRLQSLLEGSLLCVEFWSLFILRYYYSPDI